MLASTKFSRDPKALARAYAHNFLGRSGKSLKMFIVSSLLLNTILQFSAGPRATSVVLLIEFIYALMMSVDCYPLQTGGMALLLKHYQN